MGKKKIVVLTGAGVSAESGISTFRDNGGLWDKYDVNDVASIDGWYRNRQLVLDFYNLRRAELEKARPNAAHLAIAALENRYEVTVVTQNVDNSMANLPRSAPKPGCMTVRSRRRKSSMWGIRPCIWAIAPRTGASCARISFSSAKASRKLMPRSAWWSGPISS